MSLTPQTAVLIVTLLPMLEGQFISTLNRRKLLKNPAVTLTSMNQSDVPKNKTKPEVWASQNVEQHEHRKLKRNGSREAQSCPMSSLLSFQPLNTWSPFFLLLLLLFNLQTCPLVPEFPLGFIVQFSYTSGVVSEILYTCYLHRFERDSVSLCWGRGTLSTLGWIWCAGSFRIGHC